MRGRADACLTTIGVATPAEGVARHYGARRPVVGEPGEGLLDGWLVHDETDSEAVAPLGALGIATRAVPLLMTDLNATASIAGAALDLARSVRR